MKVRSSFWGARTAPSGEPWYVVWPRALAILAVMLGIPALLVWWEWYKFQDCQSVGHSMLYCVGKVLF